MPSDPGTWMWAEACQMLERAERLQRQFFRLGRSRAPRPSWEPPVDVVRVGGELFIQVALPGVDTEHVEVLLEGGTLTVAGERPLPAGPAGASILRLEIPYGRFERRIDLPPIPLELHRRDLKDGCLTLSFTRPGR